MLNGKNYTQKNVFAEFSALFQWMLEYLLLIPILERKKSILTTKNYRRFNWIFIFTNWERKIFSFISKEKNNYRMMNHSILCHKALNSLCDTERYEEGKSELLLPFSARERESIKRNVIWAERKNQIQLSKDQGREERKVLVYFQSMAPASEFSEVLKPELRHHCTPHARNVLRNHVSVYVSLSRKKT